MFFFAMGGRQGLNDGMEFGGCGQRFVNTTEFLGRETMFRRYNVVRRRQTARLDDETEFGSVKQILTDETQFKEADEA